MEVWIWLSSLLYYFYVFAFCCGLRKLLHKFVNKNPDETPWLAAVYECLGTLQVCAPIFDVDFILENYGLIGVFFEILFLELVNWYTIDDSFAHPCYFLSSETTASMTGKRVPYLATGQLLGGALSIPMARLFWMLKLNSQMVEELEGEYCESDLTVSVLNGILIECIATFVCRIVDLQTQNMESNNKCAALNCTLSAALTVLGIRYTGLYIHPISASACTLFCEGTTFWEHLKIYWMAPIVGWYMAELVYAVAHEKPRPKYSYE